MASHPLVTCATNDSRNPVLELSPTSAEPITSLCPSLKDPQRYAIETKIFPAPDLVTPADYRSFDYLPPAPSASVPEAFGQAGDLGDPETFG